MFISLAQDFPCQAFFDICDTVGGYIEWNGTDEIPSDNGNDIVIVEVDENSKAIRAGKVTAIVG